MSRAQLPLLLLLVAGAPAAAAQGHQHTAGMSHSGVSSTSAPAEVGQGAFAALAEIVARLEADPATDWSKVNLEALRRHLADMDHVTLRSRVVQREVAGGFVAEVTGDAAVAGSIRRMLTAHVAQMAAEGGPKGSAEEIPDGIRLTVVVADSTDARAVARLRGLGPIGILTLGSHHGPHHEMMARGEGH